MALVGHYKLNGNANDSSGSGYHGTVYGATLATDKNGIANNCYSFNGVDDCINLNRNLLTYPENFTLSIWIYNDISGGDITTRIWHGGYGGAAGGYGFGITKANYDATTCSFNIRATDDDVVTISGITINDLEWTNIIITKNNTVINVYRNGVYVGTDTMSISDFKRSITTYLGGAGTGSSYKGKIDDVRIYDTALSLKEIKQLSQGKFAHYKFDGNAKDCSGNELHGTAYNNISYNTLTPLIGSSSLYIPGTANNDYIALPFGNGFNPSIYNLSISMWIKFNGVITDNAMIISSNAVSNDRFWIGYNTGNLWIGVQNNVYSVDIITNLNERGHIGLTFNKSTLKVNIYYNGILAGSYDYTSYAFARNIWLGTHTDASYTWNGLIDDVQFFSTALTQQDFIDIMQTSASITNKGDIIVNEIDEVGVANGLVGYWNFKEGSGTSFYNKVNKSTYTGVVDLAWATWTEDGIATSKLSTTKDMVYVPVVAKTDFITGDLTYSFLFKRTSQKDTYDYLLSRRSINIYILNGTEIQAAVLHTNPTGEGVAATTTGASIINNVWFHVAVLIHQNAGGGGYIKIYIDGVLKGTADLASYIANATYATTAHLRWGAEPWISPTMTSAEFKDTRIYNRVLTEKEILTLYNYSSGKANKNKQLQSNEFIEDLGGLSKIQSNGNFLCNEIKEI